jgi:hypothetical protein
MLSGDEGDSSWLLPDVMVNVSRGDGPTIGIVKEVLTVWKCLLGSKCMYNFFHSMFFSLTFPRI